MSKNLKYVIWVLLVVVLAALIFLVVLANNQNKNKINDDVENKVNNSAPVNNEKAPVANQGTVNNNASGSTPKADPVYTKTIAVDYMKDSEKKTMGIPETLKVQVLERDAEGTVLAYKIIRSDSDIMTKYGN